MGGGVLLASSPVIVGAGLFVPGFAALGLGGLLLLLPPRERGEGRHRAPLHVLRSSAAAGGRATLAVTRGSGHAGARSFRAVAHFAANDGRDGAIRIGAAASSGAVVLGHTASVAGSGVWAAVEAGAPRVWHGLVVLARTSARETRSASSRLWVRMRPLLRRAWLACRAFLAVVAEEVAVLARRASERVSAYVDSRSRPR